MKHNGRTASHGHDGVCRAISSAAATDLLVTDQSRSRYQRISGRFQRPKGVDQDPSLDGQCYGVARENQGICEEVWQVILHERSAKYSPSYLYSLRNYYHEDRSSTTAT